MARPRIIIADDESIIRLDLKEMLISLGYLVVGDVGDGQSAVNLARQLKPDLMIMDIKMPGMDGIEAASILTAEKIAPVVLLTAFGQRELIERGKEAGVVGYLIKPFRESDLPPAIEIALARFDEFKKLEKQAGNLKQALETRKLVNRAKGVLMARDAITEKQAFRRIQKMSMNTGQSMAKIADAIILAYGGPR